MKDRTLALAGLLQAIDGVLSLAATGHADPQLVDTAIDSVLRIDAPSTEAVFGGCQRLQRGLRLLRNHLEGGERPPQMARIAWTVLRVERQLMQRPGVLTQLRAGLEALGQRRETEPTETNLESALGELYALTISTLQPRVLVQGNPTLLSQATIVCRIRALLLAAVRAAVLWRQLGGSYWDFVLRRGPMLEATRAVA